MAPNSVCIYNYYNLYNLLNVHILHTKSPKIAIFFVNSLIAQSEDEKMQDFFINWEQRLAKSVEDSNRVCILDYNLHNSMETIKYSIIVLPSVKTKISPWKENACLDMKIDISCLDQTFPVPLFYLLYIWLLVVV